MVSVRCLPLDSGARTSRGSLSCLERGGWLPQPPLADGLEFLVQSVRSPIREWQLISHAGMRIFGFRAHTARSRWLNRRMWFICITCMAVTSTFACFLACQVCVRRWSHFTTSGRSPDIAR